MKRGDVRRLGRALAEQLKGLVCLCPATKRSDYILVFPWIDRDEETIREIGRHEHRYCQVCGQLIDRKRRKNNGEELAYV